MKFPKLNLVCNPDDMRPFIGVVYMTKEYTYATNAHILVRHKTEKLMKPEFIANIPDGGICIPYGAICAMVKSSTIKAELRDSKIVLIQKDGAEIHYLCPDISFPNSSHLFKNIDERKSISEIGISARLLNNLATAMGCERLRLYFFHQREAIYVTPNDDCEFMGVDGIIMPVTIS